jgi:hypothetical protein
LGAAATTTEVLAIAQAGLGGITAARLETARRITAKLGVTPH